MEQAELRKAAKVTAVRVREVSADRLLLPEWAVIQTVAPGAHRVLAQTVEPAAAAINRAEVVVAVAILVAEAAVPTSIHAAKTVPAAEVVRRGTTHRLPP